MGSIFTMEDSGSSSSYTFTAPQSGYYYGVLTDLSVENIRAVLPDGSTTYSNTNRDFILDLGYLESGEQVTLSSSDGDGSLVSVNVYRLLQNEFIDAISQLNEEGLVVDSYSDTEINAHITVQEDGILFTSIPYEDGWTVYVDGQAVETEAYAEAFLSISLTAGDHTVYMHYSPAGLTEGAIISLASLLILLLIIAVRVIRNRDQKRPSLDEQRKLRFPKENLNPAGSDASGHTSLSPSGTAQAPAAGPADSSDTPAEKEAKKAETDSAKASIEASEENSKEDLTKDWEEDMQKNIQKDSEENSGGAEK